MPAVVDVGVEFAPVIVRQNMVALAVPVAAPISVPALASGCTIEPVMVEPELPKSALHKSKLSEPVLDGSVLKVAVPDAIDMIINDVTLRLHTATPAVRVAELVMALRARS